jgi:hypothetical protein
MAPCQHAQGKVGRLESRPLPRTLVVPGPAGP